MCHDPFPFLARHHENNLRQILLQMKSGENQQTSLCFLLFGRSSGPNVCLMCQPPPLSFPLFLNTFLPLCFSGVPFSLFSCSQTKAYGSLTPWANKENWNHFFPQMLIWFIKFLVGTASLTNNIFILIMCNQWNDVWKKGFAAVELAWLVFWQHFWTS